jgi:sigma-E factor negative regulatory protein RseB
VADRQCRRISIVPRDGLRYGYSLCADVETNLLLKAQTLDASNHIVEQIAFTAVRQGSDVDPGKIGSRWSTTDWKVVQADAKPVDLSAQGWRIPAPRGYAPVMQVSRRLGKHGSEVSQMVLSDGLAAISVFIEPYDASRHARASSAGLVRHGAINIYGKRVADFWLTAMGEAPMAALEQLVQAVEFVPGPVAQPR